MVNTVKNLIQKQSATDAIKTTSKRVIQKEPEEAGHLVGKNRK